MRSQTEFHSLIQSQIDAGIPSNRIVLGGFSQGGAMALLSGLSAPHKLGGIFGLSCYLLLQNKVKDLVPAENPNKDTKIFMGHGDADNVVQHEWGKLSAEKLKELGWNVDFKTYRRLGHSASEDEIDDLEKYLTEVIPPLGDAQKAEESL